MRAPVNEGTPSNAPQMKPWIAAIHAYVPGRSKAADGRELAKLSANENPRGTSPAALEARAAAPGPARYPDPESTELRAARLSSSSEPVPHTIRAGSMPCSLPIAARSSVDSGSG